MNTRAAGMDRNRPMMITGVPLLVVMAILALNGAREMRIASAGDTYLVASPAMRSDRSAPPD